MAKGRSSKFLESLPSGTYAGLFNPNGRVRGPPLFLNPILTTLLLSTGHPGRLGAGGLLPDLPRRKRGTNRRHFSIDALIRRFRRPAERRADPRVNPRSASSIRSYMR
jgi:hypothetical protein